MTPLDDTVLSDPGESVPWARPRPSSIPVDPIPIHSGASFAEKSNREFLSYLRSYLGGRCAPSTSVSSRTLAPGNDRVEVYHAVINDIRDRDHKYMIVFHRWTDLKVVNRVKGFKITMEVVFYRHGKHHGKHVEIDAYVDHNLRVAYTEIKVLGIVLQEEISNVLRSPDIMSATPLHHV